MMTAPNTHPFFTELSKWLDQEVALRAGVFDGVDINYAVLEIQPNERLRLFGWAQITLFGEDGSTAYGYFIPENPSQNPEWMHLRRDRLWPLTDKTPPVGPLPPIPEFIFRIPAAPEPEG